MLSWENRLPVIYPSLFTSDFSFYHAELWEYVDRIQPGKTSPAFIACWPRGGGKSTNAEALTVELGAQNRRFYAWYVKETQAQADKSVQNINRLLEGHAVSHYYPGMAERAVGKYGHSLGWRVNRLMTASGFIVDSLGLDRAVRGTKNVEYRPDLIIFDDVDGRTDTQKTTDKKIITISESIIPAGSPDAVIIFIQNQLLPDGVMSQLLDGRAEFLLNRITSGPYVAVEGLQRVQQSDGTYKVTGGRPTWPGGYGLDRVEFYINQWGPTAFDREAQHEIEKTGGLYDHIEFQLIEWGKIPDLERISVWVDPAVTSTDKSDNQGISASGVSGDRLYRLYAWEGITSPGDALQKAIIKAVELGADRVGVETDQGGDLWKTEYKKAVEDLIASGRIRRGDVPRMVEAKAGAGHGSKVHRGQKMLTDYERGKIYHAVGTHDIMNKALRRFPNKPLDLADAMYWDWYDLIGRNRKPVSEKMDFYGEDPARGELETERPTRTQSEIMELLNG